MELLNESCLQDVQKADNFTQPPRRAETRRAARSAAPHDSFMFEILSLRLVARTKLTDIFGILRER